MKRHAFGIYLFLAYISLVMVSCNTGKKFNYATAYKFSVPQRYEAAGVAQPKSEAVNSSNISLDTVASTPDQLLVSTEKNIVLPKRVISPVPSVKLLEKKVVAPAASDLSTLSVKEIRKEIRVGFKKYRQEIKDKNKANESAKVHDGAFVKGIALVIIGLAMIVAGIVVANNILWLGSIIAGVGLVLFLIGLLKLIL